MTCPHCAHFHETTYPELKKRYIDTGKVRFIFREFPLDPLAAGASMLARCADKDEVLPADRDAVPAAAQVGGGEADPAAAGDRQAGRLQRAELQRLPVGPEDARRDRRPSASAPPTSSASIPRRPCSSTARCRRAACRSRNWRRSSIRCSRADRPELSREPARGSRAGNRRIGRPPTDPRTPAPAATRRAVPNWPLFP